MKVKNHKQKQTSPPLIFDTYLTVIKNSVGSKLFRNFYVKNKRKKIDVLKNGELFCAFFVSSILYLFKLIKDVHTTVDSTVKDLQESAWQIVKRPKAGSIIVWEKIDFGGGDIHKHIGFYIGKGKAISNNYKLGYPTEHNWIFPKRQVEMIFWNKKLEKNIS
jgi:hypothetical protein